MAQANIDSLYRPNHDENARQAFAGALKGFVNGPMEVQLADIYDKKLQPEFEAGHSRSPQNRDEATALFEQDKLFQIWGSSVYTSQDLLWESVGETIDRLRPLFEQRQQKLANGAKTLGSLTLDPDLKLPEPIASREIHRQPGGYFYSGDESDLTSPLLYFASIELYRMAKGMSTGATTGEPGMFRFMIKTLLEKFPDFKPKRILDIGCGPGLETMALTEAFPDAEIHALDLSAPFVKFGHLWAEENGKAVHFHQGNAADTGMPDGHFDLVISHILFHETSSEMLPKIMAEGNRLLADNGVFFSADVPYQPHMIPMPRQVTNGWQVDYNGEPFWNGFADTNVSEELAKAGFDDDKIFADYVPLGAGFYYMFGGHKRG